MNMQMFNFEIYLYICERMRHSLCQCHLSECLCVCVSLCSPRTVKSGETLVDARGDTAVQIVRCARDLGRETNRTIRITEAQQRVQVKRMIEGIRNVPCSSYSQTLNG